MNHYCKLCRAELIPFALTDQKKNRVLTCPLCIDKYPPELFTIIIKNSDNMKTQLEDAKQSLEVALEELNHWKESLKLIGETPEQVYESWRTRHIKMFKYIRLMTAWRGKYNLLCEKYLQRK